MILRTLYAKLALALVLLLLSVGALFALLTVSATRAYLEELSQRFNRDLARNLVSDEALVRAGELDRGALEALFDRYMVINPSIEIYLLDLEGTILAYSADPGKVKRRRVSVQPIREFLDGSELYPLLGDDPRSHDRRKIFSVTPVPEEKEATGYLYVVLQGEQVDTIDAVLGQSYIMRLGAWALGGSLLFGALAGLVLFRLLTRRLQRLDRLMDRFRASGFQSYSQYAAAQAPVRDEIDGLGFTFDAMAARIVEQLEELRSQDVRRRETVAHISHDLRTPLTALHGYLETLRLKWESLSESQRSEHIGSALNQSDRLRRLVDQLFELAKLDARDTLPEMEPFAAAEHVQDVLQKFRLTAERAGIELRLKAAQDLSLAFGDVALVERVLDNLIENALRHTPRDGRVTVRLAEADGTLHVSVSDTGPGIPAEERQRVVEPFYQGGDRHRGSGQAGLGLAIAQRIAELHGFCLGVGEASGGGARFEFRLPLAREQIVNRS